MPRHKLVAKATQALSILCSLSSLACHSAPVARFASGDSALSQLKSQTDCSRAVIGEAQLVVSRGPFSQKADILYMAAAPDRLRFDLYSAFGVTLSTLTSDGERFALYSLEDKSFWYGPARSCNLERFTQVPVPPFALVELLRGRPPVLAHGAKDIQVRLVQPWFSKPYYRVDILGDHESTQRLKIGIFDEDFGYSLDKQRLKLLSVEVRQAGSLMYRVELDGYHRAVRWEAELGSEELEMAIAPQEPSGPECSAAIPRSLSFEVPDSGYSFKILNEEVEHNPPLSAGSFTQPPPEGVVAHYSDCSD